MEVFEMSTIDETKQEIDLRPVLDYFKDAKHLSKLEKALAIFSTESTFNFAEILNRNFPYDITNELFAYLISDSKMETTLVAKNHRETLGRINLLKDLYGPLINLNFKKQLHPFMLQRMQFSGEDNAALTNLTIGRNDGANLSVQLDFNTILLIGIQTFQMIELMYKKGENKVDLDMMEDLLNAMVSFASTVTSQSDEMKELTNK